MPRQPHPTSDWGTLEIGYTDEFGTVAPDVYEAAGRVWRRARDFAQRVLRDADDARARTLLLKAASQVSRARDERGRQHVNELDGYLLQAFRRVVFAESEKDENRRRFESEAGFETELRSQASNVERRILLEEIVGMMDEWTRTVFECLALDYSFDEIARHLGMNTRVVRNRYNRHLKALMKEVAAEHDDCGGRGPSFD